jgi:hypothetical protein
VPRFAFRRQWRKPIGMTDTAAAFRIGLHLGIPLSATPFMATAPTSCRGRAAPHDPPTCLSGNWALQ